MDDLSKAKQKINQLNKERERRLESIMKSGKLLSASFYERYTKCSNPNCKCAKGERHGPFPWIYRNRKGEKLISTSCAEDKVNDARGFSENYKSFRKNRDQIKKIDKEIDTLISKIAKLNDVDANEFTKKKEGENRGRKQKQSEKSTEE